MATDARDGEPRRASAGAPGDGASAPPAARRALASSALPTQFGPAATRRAALDRAVVFRPSSSHGAVQTRAVSNSKKAKKARAKASKSRGGGTGGSGRSRYGPDGARRGPVETDASGAPPKPVREDLDMAELRIDSLLNELVDGGEEMSNRAKFRALPVDNAIMRKITEQNLCTTASQAGRESRKFRNKGEETKITKRYALYGALSAETKALLGHAGGKKTGTKFMYAATNEASLPEDDGSIPEVAFAGRSNVGKSSLINAVTLSGAARSSDVPGKTQSLNFYDVSRRLRVVDMPGYGFAFANDDVVTDWNRLMDRYLTGRKSLKRVYVVVDARHGLKKPDREMLAFLSKYGGVSYAVVLNKTDLVKPADLARRAFLIKEELRAAKRARAEVWMASTSTGAGVAEFGAELLSLAAECAPGEGGKVDRAAASAAAAAAAAAATTRLCSTPSRKMEKERRASWTSGGTRTTTSRAGGGWRGVDPGAAQRAETGGKGGERGKRGERARTVAPASEAFLCTILQDWSVILSSRNLPAARFRGRFFRGGAPQLASPPHAAAPTSPRTGRSHISASRVAEARAGAMATSAVGFGPVSGLGRPSHGRRGGSRLVRGARGSGRARPSHVGSAVVADPHEPPPELDLGHAVVLELSTRVTRALPALGGARPRCDVTAFDFLKSDAATRAALAGGPEAPSPLPHASEARFFEGKDLSELPLWRVKAPGFAGRLFFVGPQVALFPVNVFALDVADSLDAAVLTLTQIRGEMQARPARSCAGSTTRTARSEP